MTEPKQNDLQYAGEILDYAADQPNAGVVALLSGGHDSMTITDFAAQHLGTRLAGIAHCNTGIGVPETRDYVREQAECLGVPLYEYKAEENVNAKGESDPQIYRDLVVKHGFPGPPGHGMMVARLKERSMRRIARDFQATAKRPIVFVSGCRKAESVRRFGTTQEFQRQGRTVWTAPFAHFDKPACHKYMRERAIPENPVVQNLCMSGECLCGAYCSGIGERREIEYHYPHVGRHIQQIEDEVLAAGWPWRWHQRPPKWWDSYREATQSGNADLFPQEREEAVEDAILGDDFNPLCSSCEWRAQQAGMTDSEDASDAADE